MKTSRPEKILALMFGYLLWLAFIQTLIGRDAARLLHLIFAVWCRFVHARDSQVFETLTPEVIYDGYSRHH